MPLETTLSVRRITVKRLQSVGRMQESYDALINRLLDEREQYGVLMNDTSSQC